MGSTKMQGLEKDKVVTSILNHTENIPATEREKIKGLVRAGKIAEAYLCDHSASIFEDYQPSQKQQPTPHSPD